MSRKGMALRAAMFAGLAFIIWGETAHPGAAGLHGTGLVTSVALAAAALGWIGWAIAGPAGTSRPLTVFVCWTGVAGAALLFVHPAPAVCWFAVWACVDAGAALPRRIGLVLMGVCCGILVTGYLMHRGDLLATFAAVAFVAYLVGRNRREQARSATLTERNRIAAELHDILGHSLTALSLQVEAASAALEVVGDQDQALLHLEKAARLTRSGQEEAVAVVRTLREETVDLQELTASLIDSSGMAVELTVTGTPRPLPANAAMTAYRVVQEALTNAGKHAPHAGITIVLSYGADELKVTVASGSGGSANPVGGGQGLRGMRERVAVAGGTVSAGATDDGWLVKATVPA
jgi:signal transduction histidine kinase